jgi:hypothetical protein
MEATKLIRHAMVEQINTNPLQRDGLENLYGQVWNTKELQHDFSVIGFAAPLIIVTRKSDNKKGSLLFQHAPRFYFFFEAH